MRAADRISGDPDMTTPAARGERPAPPSPGRSLSGFDGLVSFMLSVFSVFVLFVLLGGVFDLAVMLGMQLAGLVGVVGGMRGVTSGDMGMMARRLGVARFMVGGGFAVVLGGQIVVIGGVGMVLVSVVRRVHLNILSGLGAKPTGSRSAEDDKPGAKTKMRRLE